MRVELYGCPVKGTDNIFVQDIPAAIQQPRVAFAVGTFLRWQVISPSGSISLSNATTRHVYVKKTIFLDY